MRNMIEVNTHADKNRVALTKTKREKELQYRTEQYKVEKKIEIWLCTENENNYKVGTNHIVRDHLKYKIVI